MNMRVHTAIAYIKPHIPSDDPAPVVSLGDDHSPILREFAPGLLTAYLVDDGEKFSYVQGRDLRAVGMPEEELHWLAVANLAELADGKVSIRQSSRVWTLFFDGNFEASLMLLDDLWTNSLRVYAPDPIVAIPARDVLAFCNVESADGIAELRAVVERVCCLWATTSCRRAFIVVWMEDGGYTKSSNSRLPKPVAAPDAAGVVFASCSDAGEPQSRYASRRFQEYGEPVGGGATSRWFHGRFWTNQTHRRF